MNENNGTKKREWVKNAIIIFLIVMLILTFFSNTIMNYSLPEVSAQYARGGTLSEQIRGSGIVMANQVYEIKIDETREIASAEVAVGEIVEKGQTIYKLEDSESEKLETAREGLAKSEKTYKEMLLASGADYSIDNLDIANQQEDIELKKAEYSKLSSYTSEYEKAKASTKKYQSEVNDLSSQLTALEGGDYTSMNAVYYNKISSAKAAMDNKEKSMKNAEEEVKQYEGSAAGSGSALISAKQAIEDKRLEIEQLQMEIALGTGDLVEQTKTLQNLQLQLSHLEENYSALYGDEMDASSNAARLDSAKKTLTLRTNEYNSVKKKFEEAVAGLKGELNKKLENAKNSLEEAKEKEEELRTKVSKTPEEYEKEIREMERALEKAKLNLMEKQRKDAEDSGKSALSIQAQQDEIKSWEEKIKKLESKSVGAEIKAQVSGKITELRYSAGEEAKIGETVARIEMSEKGYTLEMNVTAEQARKVRTGDSAEIMYFWYGDAHATLQSIGADQSNPSNSKILKFSVTGDVTPGQTLQLSMGGKGQNYDTIVPNSAIREDNNGKFVLVVKAKSSPLGNRYIAERADIEVLASDDTSSAISGAFSGYGNDFIITAATKPIEPGMQVRLVDN